MRASLALVLAAFLAATPSRALVTLNDGRDKIYVNGSLSVAQDSNIFASNGGEGDFVYTSSVSADYTRRAGWIGVNGSASLTSSRFVDLREQDFDNPSFNLEFTKQTGRTTGSVTLSAARESRADAAVNLRSTSWYTPVGLNLKYPIAGAYTLSGSMGYSSRDYVNEDVFANLDTYYASFDLLRTLSSERDLILGYRYRYNESSHNTSAEDHGASIGISGKLIRGIMGNLRVGYQQRDPRGPNTGAQQYHSWTASGTTNYSISRRANVSGTFAKDFAITATNANVDTTMLSLDGQYTFSARLSTTGSATVGDIRFLGEGGRVVQEVGPPVVYGPNRHDNYLTWTWAANYSLNEHFKASVSYTWFKNWSTIEFADFVRSTWALTVSTRW